MARVPKWIALLLVSVLTLGAATGCSKGSASGSSAAGGGNQILNLAKLTTFTSCDQSKVNDALSNEVMTAVMDGLFSLDAKGNLQNLMCSSYEASKDGLTYTFHLRDAKWSNGDPVTANDFVYSWRRLVDPKTGSKSSGTAVSAGILNAQDCIDGKKAPSELGVSATDDHTLVVKLSANIPYFLKMLIRPCFLPINQKFYEKVGSQYGLTPATTLYNGPFVWTTWDGSNNLSATQNKTYWNVKNTNLGGITWKVVKDQQTGAMLFESGSVDFQEVSGDLIQKYTASKSFTKAQAVHMWYVIPNFHNKYLSNLNIRKALATSFDKQAIADTVMDNGATAANYIVGYRLCFGPNGKQMPEQYNNLLAYNASSAQQEWKAGLQELGTSSATLNLMYWDDPASIAVSQYMASQWEKNLPGLKVTLSSTPKAASLTKASSDQFDLFLFRWGPDFADPTAMLSLFTTDSSYSSYNFGHFDNAEFNSILDNADSPSMLGNLTARWNSLVKAQQILLQENAGIFPVVQNGLGMLVNPKVHGLEIQNVGLTWNYRIVTKDK